MARATVPAERWEDADLLARNERMAWTVGEGGLLRQLAAQTTRPDSLGSLAAIRVPVLVLSGGRDEVCPPHLQQELVDRCPHAELATVESGGHMLPLECPDQVAAAVRGWLVRSGIEDVGRSPQ
jgi:pimeloyl-ACP methyl ester carboxylesterase